MLTLFGLTWNKKKPNRKRVLQKREDRRKQPVKPIAKLTERADKPKEPSFFERLALLWASDIGVDLGTSNILVYVKNRGIVLNEPSVVARYVRTNEIIAVGEAAKAMMGRTPDDIEVIRPLREGVIADYDTTEYMLRYFVQRVLSGSIFFKPRILVCIPSGITSVEKRAVLEASLQTGARKTVLIEEPLAAALGTGLDKASSSGVMVVDMGGGTTDIAVICNTGVVVSESLRIGSDKFDEALINFFKKRRKLVIGQHTAEALKIAIGTVDRKAQPRETDVKGRDLLTGLPKTMTVSSKDVQKALEYPVQLIIEQVKLILEKTPPEMVADIVDHGIVLTGGGALIDGFDRLLTRSTGIATYLSDNPLFSVVLGTGRALSEMTHFQDSLEDLQ